VEKIIASMAESVVQALYLRCFAVSVVLVSACLTVKGLGGLVYVQDEEENVVSEVPTAKFSEAVEEGMMVD
jgi:hypothetical protein